MKWSGILYRVPLQLHNHELVSQYLVTILERQKSNHYIVKKLTVKKAEFGNSNLGKPINYLK